MIGLGALEAKSLSFLLVPPRSNPLGLTYPRRGGDSTTFQLLQTDLVQEGIIVLRTVVAPPVVLVVASA